MLILIALALPAKAISFDELSHDPQWLRLYQYRQSWSGLRSDIESRLFFFSEKGRHDPSAEMESAVEAFSKNDGKYGTLELPARCAFPARKIILERILNRKFPSEPCPDLERWIRRIDADKTNLVFVGAYAGNAASILGHTFFRLKNTQREKQGRQGLDLLSHSVGYTAHSSPTDGRAVYMMKGLTGGYPGFYDIEPYYMKVGLYNNSESRDLWDVELNLTPIETELLVKVIWEYTFNAEIRYYFIGRNCSYRLLKLLEIVRPELDVSQNFTFEVLPAETVRVLRDAGVIREDIIFRSSIRRRLHSKMEAFSILEKKQFHLAKTSLEGVAGISDPTVTDALLDYWLYENYRENAKLSLERSKLMEATFRRAAELPGLSRFQRTDEEIRKEQHLAPPFVGHRPRWIETTAGLDDHQVLGELSFRQGVHPLWSPDPAYQEISAIEYLGFDLKSGPSGPPLWTALIAKVHTLENAFDGSKAKSWMIEANFSNQCLICKATVTAAQISGAYGLSLGSKSLLFSVLPEIKGAVTASERLLVPGVKGILRWSWAPWVLLAESEFILSQPVGRWSAEVRWGYALSTDHMILLKSQNHFWGASWALFF